MGPQSRKDRSSEGVMASNGYSNAAAMAKESKDHSPPCESVNCMCA